VGADLDGDHYAPGQSRAGGKIEIAVENTAPEVSPADPGGGGSRITIDDEGLPASRVTLNEKGLPAARVTINDEGLPAARTTINDEGLPAARTTIQDEGLPAAQSVLAPPGSTGAGDDAVQDVVLGGRAGPAPTEDFLTIEDE
jgi:hypothetical protein